MHGTINPLNVIRLTSVVVLGLGFLLVGCANVSRENRRMQVMLPVFALAWIGIGQIALLAWGWPASLIRSFLNFIRLGAMSGPLADGPLFDLMYLGGFALVKRLWLNYMRRSGKGGFFGYENSSEAFYEWSSDKNKWLLKSEMLGMRTIARVAACVLVAGALALEWMLVAEGVFHAAFIPLIVLEIAFFLGGMTKTEFSGTDVDQEGSRNVYSFTDIHRALRHYFGDRELAFLSTSMHSALAEGNVDICAAMGDSADPDERMCGAYFSSILREGLVGKGGDNSGKYESLVHDRMLDTVRLMHGESILFSSPYYGDYVPYVALPLNTTLLRGGKVLIIAGVEGAIQYIPEFVDECVSFVTNVPNMWEVSGLNGSGTINPDVAVVSYKDLDDLAFIDANSQYLQDVAFCIIIDPSSLLSTYQIGLVMLADELAKNESPTYCAFDRNVDGLVDSLSHALRVQLVEVGATDRSEGASYGMFWEVDGAQLQNRLMDGVSRYLGVGTELSLVALREQVQKVTWTGSSSSPLLDVRWIDGQYYADLFEFAELPQEQSELDRHIDFCPYPYTLNRIDKRFMVVEDEHNNMFEEYRQNSSRGVRESFVNVLVPNYLLRMYMARNASTFLSDPKAVPALAADVSKNPRNVVYGLVMTMVQTGEKITEADIARKLRYVGYPFSDAGDALAYLMVEYFANLKDNGLSGPLVCDEREEYDSYARTVVTTRYFGLSVSAQSSESLLALRNVPLITEMPDGTQKLVGMRVYDQLHQTYLVGQFLSMDGKYYEIVSTSLEGGMLLRRAADHFVARRYYRQLRAYTVVPAGEDRIMRKKSLAGIQIVCELASIDVTTTGYLDMRDYGNVFEARKVQLDTVPDRHYVNKEILRFTFSGAGDDVVRTIAVVLSELLVTLYPKDHQYLAVLCSSGSELPEGILYNNMDSFSGDEVIIVEDCSVDIGLLSSVERNAQRILELCFEYLDWHEEMIKEGQYSTEAHEEEPKGADDSGAEEAVENGVNEDGVGKESK